MKYFTFALLALLLPPTVLRAEEFDAQRAQVIALGKLTAPPAMQDAKGFESSKNVKAIYFDALPWQGKPTKVFAWLGWPAKRKGKVPGIVLVHGGGGTAFREWVEKWNEHGYAAIAIAHEGQIDQRAEKKKWKQHAWPGPSRNGIYADTAEPLKEQWMYHAVADTILANSLLRSLPEVDADNVGIMGISWGGVITSTVMGIDSRFAFAIPTYGCGHMFDAENQWGRALGTNTFYREVWDPMLYLDRAKMPALWFSWPEDNHFPLGCQAASYHTMNGPYMVSLIPGMRHSSRAGWNPPDSYAFAKSIVKDGQPWCRQTGVDVKDGSVEVTFASAKPLDNAVLISTVDTGFTGDRNWTETPAKLEKRNKTCFATASLPKGTTAWLVNVHSSGLTASSDYQEIE